VQFPLKNCQNYFRFENIYLCNPQILYQVFEKFRDWLEFWIMLPMKHKDGETGTETEVSQSGVEGEGEIFPLIDCAFAIMKT
jgi:hypothetical protein